MKTRSIACAIFADMQPLKPHAAFREALLDFADEPTPRNVQRYLAASRLLARAPARRPNTKKKGSKE